MLKNANYYKVRKRNKYALVVAIIVFIIIMTGCGKETEESFEGYGNNISNMIIGVMACEGENNILFQGDSGHLYTLNKETEKVSILCKDPACGHGDTDKNCIARKSVCNMQYFNGCYYYADLFNEGYFKTDEKTVKEVEHTGDININGCAFIYNDKLYYEQQSDVHDEEYSRQDIVYKDMKDSKETVIPIGEHIAWFFPQDEGIFILTDEEVLYFVNKDGSGKKKLSDDKIDMMLPDGQYVYYTSVEKEKEGLYRMKKDGTEVKQLGKGKIIRPAVCKDYVYYSDISEENKGLYVMNKDGTGIKKICDKAIIVSAFENYNKVIGQYYDEPSLADGDNLVIMNKDGSDLKKLELPEIVAE